jgi:hypothetical protein
VPAAIVAVIPLIVLFNGLPPAWELTPTFVRTNMLASYLAFAALVLVAAAMCLESRCHARPRSGGEEGTAHPWPAARPSDHELAFVYRSGGFRSEAASDPVTKRQGG